MKAVALISGGLDSILAARVVQEQDVEILPFHFAIPFCHHSGIDNDRVNRLKQFVQDSLKVLPVIQDISTDFLSIVKKPAHGFGAHMNPCIDCKILMLRKAKELLSEKGAEFIITGEVLGQRPMSQYRHALKLIEQKSGSEGFVVRPLSAQLLDETIPEQKGWIARRALFSFNGRSRKPQIALARQYGIAKYPNPAGGCLLTDPAFSLRLKDLLLHKDLTLENIALLKIGRHFRLSDKTKLVVGRNERENSELLTLAKDGDYVLMPSSIAGPTSLGRGVFTKDVLALGAAITCRYCDLNGLGTAEIFWRSMRDREEETVCVAPLAERELLSLRI